MRRRRREDKDMGKARRNTRLEGEKEKEDDKEDKEKESEVVEEVEEEVEEERAAMTRWRAMLTAARREAWSEVR